MGVILFFCSDNEYLIGSFYYNFDITATLLLKRILKKLHHHNHAYMFTIGPSLFGN